MTSWRTAALITIVGGLLLGVAISIIFQDNITRYRLNPRTPFQTYMPPPPPAYEARGAWAIWPDKQESGEADVFYIHSTTFTSKRHWNGPIGDSTADARLRRVAAPNEAGPFMNIGSVYGPRYRQATLFATFTHKFDGLAARELAYGDIVNAFEIFLRERTPNRPIVLVGYGQGGLYVVGLLQNYFADDAALRSQLAAAYVINHPIALDLFDNELNVTPPCRTADSVGCVVNYIDLEDSFDAEKYRYRQRSLSWANDTQLQPRTRSPLLCVNPISWRVDEEYAGPDGHVGSASATGFSMADTPPAVTRATGARCDKGILIVDRPSQAFLRRNHWFGDHWGPQDFNLFYHDLTVDAQRRVRMVRLQPPSDPNASEPQLDIPDQPVKNTEN